jgi:hypothetical protein
MTSAKSAGRVAGMLFLLQALVAPLVNFRLLKPGTSADFLATAAGNALQIRTGILLQLLTGALSLGVAVLLTPIIRRHGERFAIAFLALCAVGMCTITMESLAVRNMLALSERFASTGVLTETFTTMGALARFAWYWTHYTNLLFANVALCVMYLALYRFSLVPRMLAGFGVASELFVIAVLLRTLLGNTFVLQSLAPLGIAQLALIGWLLMRGLTDSRAGDFALRAEPAQA